MENEKDLREQNEKKEEQKNDRWRDKYAEDDVMLTIDEMCLGAAVE